MNEQYKFKKEYLMLLNQYNTIEETDIVLKDLTEPLKVKIVGIELKQVLVPIEGTNDKEEKIINTYILDDGRKIINMSYSCMKFSMMMLKFFNIEYSAGVYLINIDGDLDVIIKKTVRDKKTYYSFSIQDSTNIKDVKITNIEMEMLKINNIELKTIESNDVLALE